MLSDTAKTALKACLVTRGRHKGLLLAKAPALFGAADKGLAYAAWQGAMLSCNPYKASIAGMMFMLHVSPVVTRKAVSPPQYFFWFAGFVGLVLGTFSLVICLDLGIEGASLKNHKNLGDFKYYVLFLHENARTSL